MEQQNDDFQAEDGEKRITDVKATENNDGERKQLEGSDGGRDSDKTIPTAHRRPRVPHFSCGGTKASPMILCAVRLHEGLKATFVCSQHNMLG